MQLIACSSLRFSVKFDNGQFSLYHVLQDSNPSMPIESVYPISGAEDQRGK